MNKTFFRGDRLSFVGENDSLEGNSISLNMKIHYSEAINNQIRQKTNIFAKNALILFYHFTLTCHTVIKPKFRVSASTPNFENSSRIIKHLTF